MDAKRMRRGTGQRLPALIACVIWAGGFELAPTIHLMQHAELAPHQHGGEQHTHEGDDAPDEHGEGALAHRGLAAQTAPPALPPIDPPRLELAEWTRAAPEQIGFHPRSRPRARAPP